ncbi:MAG: membrane protein insertase YidC [Alphaproteobacteria bacterium]
MNQEIKNLYMAIILSIFIIFVYSKYNEKKIENAGAVTVDNVSENNKNDKAADSTAIGAKTENVIPVLEHISNIDESKEPRVAIKGDKVIGSIRLRGARIDDVVLAKYKETIEKDSPDVRLFEKTGSEKPYYAEFGWISSDGEQTVKLPSSSTLWQADKTELIPNGKVVLKWDNGEGLIFSKTIELDDKYLFKITETVKNNTNRTLKLHHYGLISRTGHPEAARGAVHDGPVGFLNDKLEEHRYGDLIKSGKEVFSTKGGWIGITDRFWLSALSFDNNIENVTARFVANETPKGEKYQADYLLPEIVINQGEEKSSSGMLFAGAKEVRTLDYYRNKVGIAKFDLAIDFGWYYFLTKPFFFVLEFLYNLIGNMGLAILVFATILRGAMVPIATASNVSMAKMKKLQPKVAEIQEKFKEDKIKAQQELMALYKKERVNPAAGCLPVLIQIPVFFSLYKVLNISIEIRHAPFYGWIRDLSAPDPSSVFTCFGMLDWPIPAFFNIGILPLIMGVTMVMQQKLNPKPTDKSQAMMMKYMPYFFTFLLGNFASGLVIYWTWSNIFSIIQQRLIMKKMGVSVS